MASEIGADFPAGSYAQLQGALISTRGPFLMVQIENEYGYVGNDNEYTNALSNLVKTNFPGLKQYTNDGGQSGTTKSGLCMAHYLSFTAQVPEPDLHCMISPSQTRAVLDL